MGIYIVEIIFILTSTLVTIDSGEDKLKKTHDTGKNLFTSILLYVVVAVIALVVLAVLAGITLGGLGDIS
jgi:hypothetical protein